MGDHEQAVRRLSQGIRRQEDVVEIFVTYSVFGWAVRATAQVGQPWDGPGGLTIFFPTGAPNEMVDQAEDTGGITSEVLRAIPLSEIRKILARLKAEALGSSGVPDELPAKLETPRDWARFAQWYADLVAQGYRQPLQHMVRTTGANRNTVSARVRRSREMGLLTRPSGEHLGELTEKALGILSGHEEGES